MFPLLSPIADMDVGQFPVSLSTTTVCLRLWTIVLIGHHLKSIWQLSLILIRLGGGGVTNYVEGHRQAPPYLPSFLDHVEFWPLIFDPPFSKTQADVEFWGPNDDFKHFSYTLLYKFIKLPLVWRENSPVWDERTLIFATSDWSPFASRQPFFPALVIVAGPSTCTVRLTINSTDWLDSKFS